MMLRIPQVMERTGLRRTTIYKLMREGNFPKPRQLTSSAVGWREDEVEEWLSARPVAELKEMADG